jgi:hypothetical protein
LPTLTNSIAETREARSKHCPQPLQVVLSAAVPTVNGLCLVHHRKTSKVAAVTEDIHQIEGHQVSTDPEMGMTDGDLRDSITDRRRHLRVCDGRIGETARIRDIQIFRHRLAMADIRYRTCPGTDQKVAIDVGLRVEIDVVRPRPPGMSTSQVTMLMGHRDGHVNPTATGRVGAPETLATRGMAMRAIARTVIEHTEIETIDGAIPGIPAETEEIIEHAQGALSDVTGAATTGTTIRTGEDARDVLPPGENVRSVWRRKTVSIGRRSIDIKRWVATTQKLRFERYSR